MLCENVIKASPRGLDRTVLAYFSWNVGPKFKLSQMCQDVPYFKGTSLANIWNEWKGE